MTKKFLLFITVLLGTFSVSAQEVDTDKTYFQALEEFRKGNFLISLELTEAGLAAAPDYHDIRILQVRNYFALKRFSSTTRDLEYLLNKAPNYEGVKALALQNMRQMSPEEGIAFGEKLLTIYPQDAQLKITKAQLLLKQQKHQEARKLTMEVFRTKGLTDAQRYALHQLLNLTVKNAIQLSGQYVDFSKNYPRTKPWYSLSTEFQHNFQRLAVIGRATYSDRSYNSGSFYEVEAYPIISKKIYAFTGIGFSSGTIFPDFSANVSVFYNFAPSFEAEGGFRSLSYGQSSFLTGIVGLSAYTGKFYLNARAFIGPERHEQLLQNYQLNLRYYLGTPENYLFGRIGSGFSPDEPSLYTQTLENPTLEALYMSGGLNKTLGARHGISVGLGILSEDISAEKRGTQVTANFAYRYKF